MDIIKENGTTLLTLNKISNWNKAFDLHFNRIMFTSKWDWEQYFLTMEHQGLVSQDRPVKEEHLWIWTTLSGKFHPDIKC